MGGIEGEKGQWERDREKKGREGYIAGSTEAAVGQSNISCRVMTFSYLCILGYNPIFNKWSNKNPFLYCKTVFFIERVS